MSLRPQSHQEYCDARVARYSYPEDYPVLGANGRMWARNRPMRCPCCGRTFYAYQPQDAPCPPHESDPLPDVSDSVPVMGARRTCGHPSCEAAEDREQFRRRLGDKTHHSLDPDADKAKVTKASPRPKLQKAGEMGGRP